MQALLADDESEDYGAREDQKDVQHDLMKRIQLHSFLYGIFVGFFVECGALIAHVLYQTLQWNNRNPSTSEIFVFSVSWASVTSMLPCVALIFLRSLLLTSNRLTTPRGGIRVQSQLDLVVWNLESRFGIGSFLGVSLAATLLDVILGLRSHIFLTATLLIMVIGSFTCMTTGSVSAFRTGKTKVIACKEQATDFPMLSAAESGLLVVV